MKSLKEPRMKTSEALVFDIKRFAVHDGTGLRTTVFFKGCPLSCRWCQNPEGLSAKRRVVYFENRCMHCRRCEQVDTANQLTYQNDRPYFHKPETGSFDHVIEACPTGAIRYDSKAYDIETLLQKIMEDRVFFRSEGGVTFSGGEPFLQKDFLIAILRRCHEEGIHTAIETSFYAPYELIEQALPYLDLIYIDLKIFDDDKHREATGVSNQLIKENIAKVLSGPYQERVIIRTPLIPGYSADDDNIHAIAEFLCQHDPNVRYELLNYNPLASAKYPLVDREYGIDTNCKMFSKDEMKHYHDLAKQAGIHHLITE